MLLLRQEFHHGIPAGFELVMVLSQLPVLGLQTTLSSLPVCTVTRLPKLCVCDLVLVSYCSGLIFAAMIKDPS